MSDAVRIPIGPELDLHAFVPRDVAAVVADYVEAAAAAGLTEVRLVHGRGKGVQRGLVQAALERSPHVVEFWESREDRLHDRIEFRRAPDGRWEQRRLQP